VREFFVGQTTKISAIHNYVFQGKVKNLAFALMGAGVLGFILSFALNTTMGLVDYLVASLWLVTVSVAGLFFLSVTGVLQASWITPYRRVVEAMLKVLPLATVLMLGTLAAMHTYYEWSDSALMARDPILQQKTWWLTVNSFIGRMVAILIVWNVLAYAFNSLSSQIEKGWTKELGEKSVKLSAVGIILYGMTICIAAFDWIMSIEPHWFSTIFGVYVFAGTFVAGISFTTLITIFLKEEGTLSGVINENHLHDLGKWMFGMSVFWAYIWVSQYLLIWYANIPEETEYYHLRSHHGWNIVFFANLIINFVTPFFVLMSRGAKRCAKTLKIMAIVLLFGHFFDLYLMVAPKIFHHHDTHLIGYGLVQVLQFLGVMGVMLFGTLWFLSKRAPVSEKDPNFAEGLHLHQ
jgi:hypothetical protein